MAEDWVLVQNQTIAEELESEPVDLIASLKTLLSNTVSIYFRAHGYHWNVKGLNFPQLHEFFGTIYEDLYGSIDDTAEWLRKLKTDAPYRLQDFIQYRDIEDALIPPVQSVGMIKDLLMGIEGLDDCTEHCLKLATEADEQGLINFLAGRLDMLDKWEWQLKSSISEVL